MKINIKLVKIIAEIEIKEWRNVGKTSKVVEKGQ